LTKVAVGAAAMLLSMAIHAQQRNFEIPAGDLKAALDAYAAATGQQLLYKGDDLKGRVSKGAQGPMTAEQALERVLEGTNLKLRRDSSGAVVIFPHEMNASGVSKEAAAGGAVHELQAVIVTGTALSHLAEVTRTGTRTDADPMTLPMAVTSVDKELMAQQQALGLRDAVANVAGASEYTVVAGRSQFTMRGFSAGVMRNGTVTADGLTEDSPLVAIDRVEVVKGPEAIIAGITSGYGGVVNIITKTPQIAPVTEAVAIVGSRRYYELGMDVGRPLNQDKSLLVRLVASKQGAGSTIVGYDGPSKEYAAPSLKWRNKSTGTEVIAQYEHQKSRAVPALTVFTDQPSLSGDLKLMRYGPPSDGTRTTSNVTTLSLNQRITDGWEVVVKHTNDRRSSATATDLTAVGTPYGLPFPNIVSFVAALDSKINTRATKVELKGDFDTGPVEHKLLLAYDDTRAKVGRGTQFLGVTGTDLSTGVTTDLSATLGAAFFGSLPTPRFSGGIEPRETGALVMDQMLWGDWVALAGWREIRYQPDRPNVALTGEFKKSLPSLGVLYRMSPTLSVYGSASKGFSPNFGLVSLSGSTVPPEDARQFELGLKSLLMNKKVAASFALYSVKQHNVAIPDPAHPSDCGGAPCYLSVPGVRSTGAEVEVSGQVAAGLGLRASYSYNNKKADASDQLGIHYARNQASLWATYHFAGEAVGGWWVASGVQVRSARNADPANAVGNPGQVRVDLSAGYEAKEWSVVAGVKNVADKRLYTVDSGFAGMGIAYQPREFYLTARYKFN
jgi:iron complex outermembrane receptor protein